MYLMLIEEDDGAKSYFTFNHPNKAERFAKSVQESGKRALFFMCTRHFYPEFIET